MSMAGTLDSKNAIFRTLSNDLSRKTHRFYLRSGTDAATAGGQLWPSHDLIKASTPTCCSAGWTGFKSIGVTLRGTSHCSSANSKAYAHRAAARRSARKTSRMNSTTPDGISGGCTVRILQCCSLFGGTQLSDGLKRRSLCGLTLPVHRARPWLLSGRACRSLW